MEKIQANLLIKYEREEIKDQLKLCIEGFKKEFENMKICSKNNNNVMNILIIKKILL